MSIAHPEIISDCILVSLDFVRATIRRSNAQQAAVAAGQAYRDLAFEYGCDRQRALENAVFQVTTDEQYREIMARFTESMAARQAETDAFISATEKLIELIDVNDETVAETEWIVSYLDNVTDDKQ
ncbi:MAG: hypothetical protein AB7N71_04145 [Phycisphaerae bacterium]